MTRRRPNAYGAGITYDLPVERADQRVLKEIAAEVAQAEALTPHDASIATERASDY